MSIKTSSSATSPSLRLVGYARVSSNGQELQLQLDALQKVGCAKDDIYMDKASGAKSARAGLGRCLAQLAQFERRLIQERTKAGLAAARARGRLGGRKPIPASDPRVQTAKKMHSDRSMPVMDICKTLRISRPTLYRYVSMK